MAKTEWQEAGDQIRNLVQDAVDSMDFSKLSDAITGVVNDAMNSVQAAMKETMSERDPYQHTNREAAERIRRNIRQRQQAAQRGAAARTSAETAARQAKAPRTTALAKGRVPGELAGRAMKWLGCGMSCVFGLASVITAAIGIAAWENVAVPLSVPLVLFIFSLGIAQAGRQKAGLAQRFRRYCAVLGGRTYCMLEELASATSQNLKSVRRDLKKMIARGYFKEGYLDRQEKMLITDRATYQQYLTAQTEYERRQQAGGVGQGRSGTDPQTDSAKLPPECRELIREGQEYILHVHECNEKIPDEQISDKLDRLETLITRIFRKVETNPEVAGDLKKMMSYYLPTTRKLLDAYCELDAQPAHGPNIENSKREIEAALDTINTAFENLLDSLFQEKAWDISSDISVLHTMLAQEGLTGNDFEKQGGTTDDK